MIAFAIKYCQKTDGGFVDVAPDKADTFRVFMIARTEERWAHDFKLLSKAGDFIRKMREAEKQLDAAFATVLAGKQVMQEESVHAVMNALEQEIIRRII
jgi:hypothetical protein